MTYKTMLPMTALLVVSACGKDAPAASAAAPVEKAAAPTPAPAPAFDAATAFNTVCATCHGANGTGDGPAGKALNPQPASFVDLEFWKTRDRAHIVKVITEGGASVGKSPLMVAYGATYTPEQIGQLADHVMKFRPAE